MSPQSVENDEAIEQKKKVIVDVMKALENLEVEDDWPVTSAELQPLATILTDIGVGPKDIMAAMKTIDPDRQKQYLILGYQGGYDWEGGASQMGAIKDLRKLFAN
tara:strand:- start:774 stop:1088 length:315 start_codon:yes stop_codon:yes gene_type:complete